MVKLIGVIFLFMGGVSLICYAIFSLYDKNRVWWWKKTQASILDYSIAEENEIIHGGATNVFFAEKGETVTTQIVHWYYPIVTYSYSVDDVQYKSQLVCLDLRSLFFKRKTGAEHLVKDIFENTVCYYNPKLTSQAVLVRGLSYDRFLYILVLILAGAGSLFVSIVIFNN